MSFGRLIPYGGTPTPSCAPRAPLVLPTCGSCPSPTSFDQDLTKIWPNGQPPRDPAYLRTNSWGIPIPGLPWVPGITSSKHPERFLSYLFPLYPTWGQEAWLDALAARCYTHVVFSWPNARAQAGQSLSQFRADCERAKARGLLVQVKLWSKDFDPHDMPLSDWQAFAQPTFDALAGAVDEYAPWEYDSGNLTSPTALDVHKYLGDQAHQQGATAWCHFFPHVTSWEANGDPRGRQGWWHDLQGVIDGLDYQGDPSWDIGELQARSVDTLTLFGQTGHKFRQFEPGTPTLMFDGDHPTEDEADAFGFASVCTVGAAPVWGFGAGARQKDGTAI